VIGFGLLGARVCSTRQRSLYAGVYCARGRQSIQIHFVIES